MTSENLNIESQSESKEGINKQEIVKHLELNRESTELNKGIQKNVERVGEVGSKIAELAQKLKGL